MLEAGTPSSAGADEVTLQEPSAVLAIVLRYFYPQRVPPFYNAGDNIWSVVKAFDKYEVSQGCPFVGPRPFVS